MKKIVFIGFDIEGLGGISTYSRYQVKALREKFGKNSVDVYSLVSLDREFHGYVDKDKDIEYKSKFALLKIILLLIKNHKKIDVIIFNHVNLSFLGAIIKKLFRIKYIVFGYNIDLLKRFNFIQKIGFENIDKLVVDCSFTINKLKKFHKKIPKTHLLYDPVDINFFKPISLLQAREKLKNKYNFIFDEKFIITTVAVMRKEEMYKGHFEILEAIKFLNNNSILYFVVGGGDGRKLVEKKVKELGIENQVIFFGFVENELIPYFYNASDLVALISKNEYGKGEGVPLGLIEASACEVPILAGDEDGSYEAISDKYQNGFRVSPRNIDEIVEKIQFYIDNPNIKTEHGKNGRKFVIEEFSYSKFKNKQTEIIKEIINDFK
jgi:phosphatidylinositol alpha-1,6-mannosyltransferase